MHDLTDSTLFPNDEFLQIKANVCGILSLRKREPTGSGEGGKERMKQFSFFHPCN